MSNSIREKIKYCPLKQASSPKLKKDPTIAYLLPLSPCRNPKQYHHSRLEKGFGAMTPEGLISIVHHPTYSIVVSIYATGDTYVTFYSTNKSS